MTFSEDVAVAAGASFSISGGILTILFQGSVTAQQGASATLSVTSSAVTFDSLVDLGAQSGLSIGDTIGTLAFPAGLRTGSGASVSIRSSTPSSVAVAMGTTWYAVDPSSNQGSVTFGGVGLLSPDGTTVIGTADGTLPGSLSVELNGQQPGGGGAQSGVVLLALDGTITVPPEVSSAVGQVFTDDRISEFASTVSGGGAGMYGLQVSRAGAIEIAELTVSTGQDVRVFSSNGGSGVTFSAVTVMATGVLTLQGSFSTIGFADRVSIAGALVFSGAMTLTYGSSIIAALDNGGRGVSMHGGVMMVFPDGSAPTVSGALPGSLTATASGRTVASLSLSNAGIVRGTGPGGNWPVLDSGPEENGNGLGFVLYYMAADIFPGGTGAARKYQQVCEAAGRHTFCPVALTRGDSHASIAWYIAYRDTYGCLPGPNGQRAPFGVNTSGAVGNRMTTMETHWTHQARSRITSAGMDGSSMARALQSKSRPMRAASGMNLAKRAGLKAGSRGSSTTRSVWQKNVADESSFC